MAFDVQQVVEAAARAAYEDAMAKKGTPFEPWETLPGYWLRIYRAHTRAALAVIVPAVTEQVRAVVCGEDSEEWVRNAGGACMVSGASVLEVLDELDAAARGEQP